MDRRSFISSQAAMLALVAVGGGAALLPGVASADQATRVALAGNLSPAAFAAYTGEQFDLSDAQGRLVGKGLLSAVSEQRSQPDHVEFVVSFQTDAVLAGGIYSLYHPQAGVIDLFLQGSGKAYRAEFSLKA